MVGCYAKRLSITALNMRRTRTGRMSGLLLRVACLAACAGLEAPFTAHAQTDAIFMPGDTLVAPGYDAGTYVPSVFGAGKPNVVGTLFGSILIGVLLNGLTMLNVPYYTQDIIKGAVLAGALAITYYRQKSHS